MNQLAEPPGWLESLISRQHGLVTRAQVLACGKSRAWLDNEVRRGRWQRVLPGVYAVGVDGAHPSLRVFAAWLWAGPDSVVCGRAAAWCHGLVRPMSGPVEIATPRSLDPQPGVRLIRTRVPPLHAVQHDILLITSIAWTCLDLARADCFELVLTALRLGLVVPADLVAVLGSGRGRRGQRRASALVSAAADNPWSAAEMLAHRVFRDADLKGWVANPRVRTRQGFRYPDIAFLEVKLAVEIDGRLSHQGDDRFESDRRRHNALVADGWTVLHVTWKQLVEDPAMVIDQVRRTLDRLLAARAGGAFGDR